MKKHYFLYNVPGFKDLIESDLDIPEFFLSEEEENYFKRKLNEIHWEGFDRFINKQNPARLPDELKLLIYAKSNYNKRLIKRLWPPKGDEDENRQSDPPYK